MKVINFFSKKKITHFQLTVMELNRWMNQQQLWWPFSLPPSCKFLSEYLSRMSIEDGTCHSCSDQSKPDIENNNQDDSTFAGNNGDCHVPLY
jgi:hypothetical protein